MMQILTMKRAQMLLAFSFVNSEFHWVFILKTKAMCYVGIRECYICKAWNNFLQSAFWLGFIYRAINGLRLPSEMLSELGYDFTMPCANYRWQPLIVNTEDSQFNFSSNQRVNLIHLLSEKKCSCYFSDLIMQPAMLQIISISLWIFLWHLYYILYQHFVLHNTENLVNAKRTHLHLLCMARTFTFTCIDSCILSRQTYIMLLSNLISLIYLVRAYASEIIWFSSPIIQYISNFLSPLW